MGAFPDWLGQGPLLGSVLTPSSATATLVRLPITGRVRWAKDGKLPAENKAWPETDLGRVSPATRSAAAPSETMSDSSGGDYETAFSSCDETDDGGRRRPRADDVKALAAVKDLQSDQLLEDRRLDIGGGYHLAALPVEIDAGFPAAPDGDEMPSAAAVEGSRNPTLTLTEKGRLPRKRRAAFKRATGLKKEDLAAAAVGQSASGTAAGHRWICTFCGKGYQTRKGCRAHEAFQHDRSKLRHRCDHLLLHPDGDGQASRCQAAFFDPKELLVHRRKHTGEQPFICGYCGARFVSKATLVQHERARHLETEDVECEICRKVVRKRNLPAHVKTHEGFQTGLPCDVCGKKFSTMGGRNRHRKIHSLDKKFECSHCGKAFVQKVNMQAHERIHTGEKPYLCQHCGEGFVQGTRRNLHQASCRKRRPGDQDDEGPVPAP